MSEKRTEDRLALLEKEVANLRRQISHVRNFENWFNRISGSFKDEPEFDKVLALGRKIRKSAKPKIRK